MKIEFRCHKHPGSALHFIFLACFFLPDYLNAQQTPALASFKDANDKYGFKNKTGQIVVPAKYQSVASFTKEDLAAVKFNDKWGFIDKTGKEVIPIRYQSVDNFYQGLAKVEFNDKWGMIDSTGKEVVPIKYQDIQFFNEKLAPVKLNDKWGFVDKTGKVIIPTKYQSLYLGFKEGLDAVQFNDKWGFIDKTGKEIIPMKYQAADNFNEGLAKAKLNDKWGFIDKSGKEIVPFKYQEALAFKDGWAKVKSNDKWGAVDKTGSEIIPTRYDEIFHINLTQGLAKVKLDKKWGAVDKAGNEVIAIKYEDLYPIFVEDLATVKWNGKWGFIDRSGKEVIPAKYDDSRNFTDGLALVKLKWLYGLIDKTGREVVPIKYENIHGFSDGLAAVQFNKKWGFVDKTGKEVIPPQYDYAHDFSGGKALVTKDGKDYTISKPISSTGDNSVLATASANPSAGAARQPPLTMKGVIDPAIVGTWKYHNDAPSFNGFYIFRAEGTYDYYSDMITPNPPAPSYKNFWRVDGEEMEFLIDGKNEILRQKVLRRNDPQSNKPALLIPWNSATEEYRAYYPVQAHELWKTPTTSSQKSNSSSATNPVAAVKLVDPPVRLTGNVDLSVVGLWKCNYNKIDYWLDLKADGTYNTYSATNSKPVKCYWRINGDYIETFCEGAKQMSRFVFRKVNDLKSGKPTITLDGVAYFPETDKEMWKGM